MMQEACTRVKRHKKIGYLKPHSLKTEPCSDREHYQSTTVNLKQLERGSVEVTVNGDRIKAEREVSFFLMNHALKNKAKKQGSKERLSEHEIMKRREENNSGEKGSNYKILPLNHRFRSVHMPGTQDEEFYAELHGNPLKHQTDRKKGNPSKVRRQQASKYFQDLKAKLERVEGSE